MQTNKKHLQSIENIKQLIQLIKQRREIALQHKKPAPTNRRG